MVIDPKGALGGALWRLAGKVIPTWAVRMWGDATGQPTSWSQGARWSLKNYMIALVAGGLAGELVGRMWSVEGGRQMFVGTVDLCISKATWHEVIAAIPSGPKYLGNVPEAIARQMRPGDIADDGRGNRYQMQPDGKIVAMMGREYQDEMGEIVEAGPMGELVDAGPMGEIVDVTPMGSPVYSEDDDWRPGSSDRMAAW